MKSSERDFVLNSQLSDAEPDLAPIDVSAISAMVDSKPPPAPVLTIEYTAQTVDRAQPAQAPAMPAGAPVIDLGGRAAPMALLELRRSLAGLQPGTEITVIWDDAGAALDLAAVGKVAGLHVVPGELFGTYRLRLK